VSGKRDWPNDPWVLAEFCTCPRDRGFFLTDVDGDEQELRVFDINCPLHGLNAEPSPF
jgi:hypothetical protein